jgi:hypothetical protein
MWNSGRVLSLPVWRPTALAFTPAGIFLTTAQGTPPSMQFDGTLLQIDDAVLRSEIYFV